MQRTGILLINTGTPDQPKYWSVRKYLSQFLSDPRVIDIPWLFRFMLLQFFILPFRSKRSAEAYRKVWTEKGSPLLHYSLSFKQKLQQELGDHFQVSLGMRYGNPSIKKGWHDLKEKGCTKILLFPLYPHYASSSTGSALEEAYTWIHKEWNIPALKSIEPFYKEDFFINPFTQHLKRELKDIKWEHLVFSFHGLPQHHIEKSGCQNLCSQTLCTKADTSFYCYRAQSFENVRILAKRLDLKDSDYSVAFQSRLGRRPWIKPYFDEILPELRKQGIKNIAVVCPSFVADCLETLEEIRIRAAETWKNIGGNSLHLIPCLNDDPNWVRACADKLRSE